MQKTIFSFFLIICLSTISNAQNRQYFSEIALFENSKNGYACYRIPAIIKAPNGDLLAFAEGRVNGCSDFGNIDILMRKSTDNGMTWSEQTIVAENGKLQAGNPAPIVDLFDPNFPNGRIFLFYNTGNNHESEVRKGNGLREVWYITSENNGESWSKPVNITNRVHRPNYPPQYSFPEDWRSYANTPGHALQLTHGKYKGRIFIPANHSKGTPQGNFNEYRAHAFYSDDHGKTWHLSENVNIPSSNESIAVQLSDGRVLQNIRHQNGDSKSRITALSSDGGATWDTAFIDTKLPDSVCQASIINYDSPSGRVLLFSNPDSQKAREKMTVRVSFDDGKTWLLSRQIRAGESAYSDLVIQSDNQIGLLYEHGSDNSIFYAHFNWEWLIGEKNHTENAWINKLINKDLSKGFDFKLSSPMLKYEDNLFEKEMKVSAELGYPNVRLHYTLDSSDPTEESPILDRELTVNKTTIFKVRAFHDRCRPSDIAETQFLQTKKLSDIKNATLTNAPSDSYPGGGALSLFDLKKGTLNFKDSEWMGFSGNNGEVTVEFENPKTIKKVTASVNSNPGAWIFPPEKIEIFVSDDGQNFEKISEKEFPKTTEKSVGGLKFLSQSFEPKTGKFLKISIITIEKLPDWHPGKGFPGWLFLDEILVN